MSCGFFLSLLPLAKREGDILKRSGIFKKDFRMETRSGRSDRTAGRALNEFVKPLGIRLTNY